MTQRVALLIDGENVSSSHASEVYAVAAKSGRVTVRRVFGNLTHIGGWARLPGYRIVATQSGKNIADIALSLDALELALTDSVDAFCIATSDRDLALVALRLRELDFDVTGIGEAAKTPEAFRAACRAFVAFAPPPAALPPAKSGNAGVKPAFEPGLKDYLLKEGLDTDGWVALSALGQQRAKAAGISKALAGIGKSASWLDWFAKRRDAFDLESLGTQSRVRVRVRVGQTNGVAPKGSPAASQAIGG